MPAPAPAPLKACFGVAESGRALAKGMPGSGACAGWPISNGWQAVRTRVERSPQGPAPAPRPERLSYPLGQCKPLALSAADLMPQRRQMPEELLGLIAADPLADAPHTPC